jgi:manganese-dependent inorganic pyrophosphatase
MIRHGMSLETTPLAEILTRDVKQYSLFGYEVIISQVMMASDDFLSGRGPAVEEELERLRKGEGSDLYVVLFTNVIANRSHVFAAGDPILLHDLGYDRQPVVLDGVMSRKKDFLPPFGQKLRNL